MESKVWNANNFNNWFGIILIPTISWVKNKWILNAQNKEEEKEFERHVKTWQVNVSYLILILWTSFRLFMKEKNW